MLELEATRDLGGVPVSFHKLAPGGFLVVDVNGRNSIVSKEQWKSLPKWESSAKRRQRSLLAPSYEAWVVAVLFVVVSVSCGMAFLLAGIGLISARARRLMRRARTRYGFRA